METLSTIGRVGSTVARGLAREESHRLKSRVRRSGDGLKTGAAQRVESFAGQIRELGRKVDRPDQAHAIARRVERTADYLRFRPASNVPGDAWRAIRSSPTVWVAGGVVAGFLLYRVARSR